MLPVAPLQTLVELLDEMRRLVEALDDVQYALPAAGRSAGGIGGHVRHCLDHVTAWLTASCTGVCAYDRRARGTDIETNRRAALRAIGEVSAVVATVEPAVFDRDVTVETQLDRSGTMMTTRSSVGRELVFVTNHTIHHNAIVAQMLQARGLDAAPRFGLAPSTPNDRRNRRAADAPIGSEAVACAH
jgi:uncharacterized damage-inducible protein DinB